MTDSVHTDRSNINKFYSDKGLKRISVALNIGTIAFLEDKRQEFTKHKVTKQGDVVDALVAVYLDNPQFAAAVDAQLLSILDQKVMKKPGRKDGWQDRQKDEDAE